MSAPPLLQAPQREGERAQQAAGANPLLRKCAALDDVRGAAAAISQQRTNRNGGVLMFYVMDRYSKISLLEIQPFFKCQG